MKSNRCGHCRETICLLASGALEEQEKTQAEDHLASCVLCRNYYDQMKSLAAPLANWEKRFARIEPSQTLQTRWANSIKATDKPKSFPPLSLAVRTLWRELIWPSRHAWTGMAALWLVLWRINSGLSSGEVQFAANSASAPAMVERMAEQRQLLAELIPPASTQPAEPPHRNRLQPRSDRRTVWSIG